VSVIRVYLMRSMLHDRLSSTIKHCDDLIRAMGHRRAIRMCPLNFSSRSPFLSGLVARFCEEAEIRIALGQPRGALTAQCTYNRETAAFYMKRLSFPPFLILVTIISATK